MRQIREVLRLHLQAGLSYGKCGRALKMPKSTVGGVVSMARGARPRRAGAYTRLPFRNQARVEPKADFIASAEDWPDVARLCPAPS